MWTNQDETVCLRTRARGSFRVLTTCMATKKTSAKKDTARLHIWSTPFKRESIIKCWPPLKHLSIPTIKGDWKPCPSEQKPADIRPERRRSNWEIEWVVVLCQIKDEAAQKPKRAIFPSLIWVGGEGGTNFPSISSKIVWKVSTSRDTGTLN